MPLSILRNGISIIGVFYVAASAVAASNYTVKFSEDDQISPKQIRHNVEEIFNSGELEQKYNYLVYEFEKYDACASARTYLDDIGTVSVYGPVSCKRNNDAVKAPKLVSEIMTYLKRRFFVIDKLGDAGYETLWKHPDLVEPK